MVIFVLLFLSFLLNTNLCVVHSPAQPEFWMLNWDWLAFILCNFIDFSFWPNAFQGGGSLVSTLRKSYSLSDLSEPDMHHSQDEVRYWIAHYILTIHGFDLWLLSQIDAILYQHMMQQQQFQQPIHPQMRQRYMKTRLQTNAMNARSSSNSRKSDGYSRDMDPMTRSENYRYAFSPTDHRELWFKFFLCFCSYIRSSEDISSGYSSAEPMPIALSRATSLTNTAAIKLKAKRSEVSAIKFTKFHFYFNFSSTLRFSQSMTLTLMPNWVCVAMALINFVCIQCKIDSMWSMNCS